MTIRIETGADKRCCVFVDGNMTIYEAATDKLVVLQALAEANETEIDLSSVREMDTAGLQILILAKRESVKAGKVMRLVAPSPISLDVIDRYGLASYFTPFLDRATVASSNKKPRRRGDSKRRV
jgi:anti-anti-sigma factor